MRFSQNGFYVEQYVKCPVSGVLIYVDRTKDYVVHNGQIYASQWCVDWEAARTKRKAAEAAAAQGKPE